MSQSILDSLVARADRRCWRKPQSRQIAVHRTLDADDERDCEPVCRVTYTYERGSDGCSSQADIHAVVTEAGESILDELTPAEFERLEADLIEKIEGHWN